MRYMIVGGTGTLGRAVIKQIYKDEPTACISVISREELKQKKLRADFPNVETFLADVKNKKDIERIFSREVPETVFHFAAMKHVDIAEENPEECMAVNYFGTQNVAECAMEIGAQAVVFSSTDKAVLPINIYGASKLAAEKYLLEMNNQSKLTKFHVFRWANILGSRGSVAKIFADTLKNDSVANVTSLEMTRFFAHIDDVAEFMVKGYEASKYTEVQYPPMKACKIIDLVDAIAEYVGVENYKINEIGIRRGEKYHEILWSEHDSCLRSDTADQFTRTELLKLVARVLK